MTESVKGKGWRVRVSWYDADGKRHRKQAQWFPTKRAALEWEQSYLDEHRDAPPDAADITVSRWLARWLELQSAVLAENTISGYRVNCNRINRYIGGRPLARLRKIDIELMLKSMSAETVPGGKPIRPATVRYAYRTLRAALNAALENEIIKKNPCAGVRMPVQDASFDPVILSAEQGGRILTALRETDGQLYLAVLLSIIYGLRRGEALGVRWCDVDEHELRIRGQITRSGGRNVYKAALKTASSYRTLAMHPLVWDELSAVADANRRVGRIAEYVCELDGKLPSPNAISKRWEKFAVTHGAPGVRYHDLRHSAAMMMLESGADINTVKQQLGHAKISTTEMYLHADFNRSEAAAAGVVAGLFPATPDKDRETNAG